MESTVWQYWCLFFCLYFARWLTSLFPLSTTTFIPWLYSCPLLFCLFKCSMIGKSSLFNNILNHKRYFIRVRYVRLMFFSIFMFSLLSILHSNFSNAVCSLFAWKLLLNKRLLRNKIVLFKMAFFKLNSILEFISCRY